VSSTTTQSTPCCTAISSIAAMPMSLKLQHRHPFGSERNEEVCSPVEGSRRVRDLDSMSVVSPKSERGVRGFRKRVRE
jgi:hypothetical protein